MPYSIWRGFANLAPCYQHACPRVHQICGPATQGSISFKPCQSNAFAGRCKIEERTRARHSTEAAQHLDSLDYCSPLGLP